MFLRRNRRTVNGQSYEYWTLMKTVRTANGPRQQLVATLGKDPDSQSTRLRRWEELDRLLEGDPASPVQGQLGAPWPPAPKAHWLEVDISRLRVERTREFGQVYLALALWRRLGLHTLLRQLIPAGEEAVSWELIACILTRLRQ